MSNLNPERQYFLTPVLNTKLTRGISENVTFLGFHPSNHGFLSPQVGFLIHVMSSQIGLLALPGGVCLPWMEAYLFTFRYRPGHKQAGLYLVRL